jgi:hypothetical protein
MEAEHNMTRRIQLRRDTTENWESVDPVLAAGEVGVDLTTGQIKIGDGTASWSELDYYTGSDVDLAGYATEQYVDDAVGALEIPSIEGLATEQYVDDAVGALEIPSIEGLATEQYVDDAVGAIEIPDVSNFITAEDIPPIPADISDLTDTTNLLGGGGEGGSSDRLVNGELSVVLDEDGGLTLPEGGTITEGVVTENPTIELTPAEPESASQKLVIKGGGSPPEQDEVTPEEGEEPTDLYHLHLTTGDLQETSVFLGTDEHNVRTKTDGRVEITAHDYDKDISKVWKFGKTGALTLPAITPTGVWIAVNAALPNNNNDTEYRAVKTDNGNIYAVGRRGSDILITKMTNDGDIVWNKLIVPDEGADFGGGRANGVTLYDGVLYVTCEFYGDYYFSGIISMNPDTGELVEEQFALRLDNNDVVLIETQFSGDTPVAAGSRYGGYQEYTVTPQEGSATGIIIIDGTELPEGTVLYSDWSAVQIGGTGFDVFENLLRVNYYEDLTGTSSGGGEGAEFYIQWFGTDYTNFNTYGISSQGTGYQQGDTVVIPGTQLGGTSPENDLTFAIFAVGDNGEITDAYPISGTSSNSYKIETTTQVDFTQEGSWQIAVALYRENFILTPEKQISFGMGSVDDQDRLFALATDSAGHIYAVGESDNDQFNRYQATLFKFNSSLELQWARMLNIYQEDGYTKSVAVKDGFVYTVHEQSAEADITVVSKINADSGALVWQRYARSGDDSGVAVDDDGNVYAVIESYYSSINNDAIKVIKFDSTGEVVFKRWVGYKNNDTVFKNGRVIDVDDDYIYIVGYAETGDYNAPFVARLNKDGTGIGEGTNFFYNQGGYSIDIPEATEFAPITPTIVVDTDTEPGGVLVTTSNNEDPQTKEELESPRSAIVFSDGTRIDTAPVGIPQNLRSFGDYRLQSSDNGKHVFHPGDNYGIYVPPNEQLALPIGYAVTLITRDYGDLYIRTEDYYDPETDQNYYASIVGVGTDQQSGYWRMPQRSIATLIKVEDNLWYLSGPGIQNDD